MKKVLVGKVLKAQGLRGMVKVLPLTDFEERFSPGSSLWVGPVSYTHLSQLWSKKETGEKDWEELEELLIQADMGPALSPVSYTHLR